MMKHLIVASLLTCVAWSGAVAGEDKAESADRAARTVVMHEAGGGGAKSLDVKTKYDGGPQSPDSFDYGSGSKALMPMGDTYDPNTGMPDMVPSDSYGEFD
jgi:hypothetical protein